MTMKTIAMMISLFLAVGLLNCGRRESAEVPPTETTIDTGGTTGVLATAKMWIDNVVIGSELAQDGSMVAGKTGNDFVPGQTIHVSMTVEDAPVGSSVRVVWYGQSNVTIGEESKSITAGQKYLAFSAPETKSWPKGDYRAEVWVGDDRVNIQQFQIVEPSK